MALNSSSFYVLPLHTVTMAAPAHVVQDLPLEMITKHLRMIHETFPLYFLSPVC